MKKENDFLEKASAFFAASRLKSAKTKDGESKADIAFFCRTLHVSRQEFYQYLANKDRSWKYQPLADAMKEILVEDECNDTYGWIRMYQALILKQPKHVEILSECTVYRVMEKIGISHHPRRKPNGITKADWETSMPASFTRMRSGSMTYSRA